MSLGFITLFSHIHNTFRRFSLSHVLSPCCCGVLLPSSGFFRVLFCCVCVCERDLKGKARRWAHWSSLWLRIQTLRNVLLCICWKCRSDLQNLKQPCSYCICTLNWYPVTQQCDHFLKFCCQSTPMIAAKYHTCHTFPQTVTVIKKSYFRFKWWVGGV